CFGFVTRNCLLIQFRTRLNCGITGRRVSACAVRLIWILATSLSVLAQKEAMSSTFPKRLLVLGFDAMDLELAKSWASAGYLPNLLRLFDCSAWTDYVSPPEYSSGTMWPSINTGVGPLQHDFYSFGRFCEGSYRLRVAKSSDVASDPF